MNMLICMSNANREARGTLPQIRDFFSHKSLRKEVKDNIQHVWDFVVVISSLSFLNMKQFICYFELTTVTNVFLN